MGRPLWQCYETPRSPCFVILDVERSLPVFVTIAANRRRPRHSSRPNDKQRIIDSNRPSIGRIAVTQKPLKSAQQNPDMPVNSPLQGHQPNGTGRGASLRLRDAPTTRRKTTNQSDRAENAKALHRVARSLDIPGDPMLVLLDWVVRSDQQHLTKAQLDGRVSRCGLMGGASEETVIA